MEPNFLRNKVVLITGGTGSFGSAFVRHLLKLDICKKIIVFSRDEYKQYKMQQEFRDSLDTLRFFIGDVRDLPRLQRAFSGVDIVVHAAALKQVPTLEYNPFEAVKTNIVGSQNVIDAAIDQKVSKVLLISTDKAAQPINLYGSTKLCAEKLFIGGNAYASKKTIFSVVRYGNVMGSRGSIIETLLKNPNMPVVEITDESMTRFWITLPQSFELVLFALQHMQGGEIFVPKIPSMKIVDLFDVLAPKAKRKIIGIRPGEKLHEMLLPHDESRHAIELPNYFVTLPEHEMIFDKTKRYAKLLARGRAVPAGFAYMSHTNTAWLTKVQFRDMLKAQTLV